MSFRPSLASRASPSAKGRSSPRQTACLIARAAGEGKDIIFRVSFSTAGRRSGRGRTRLTSLSFSASLASIQRPLMDKHNLYKYFMTIYRNYMILTRLFMNF